MSMPNYSNLGYNQGLQSAQGLGQSITIPKRVRSIVQIVMGIKLYSNFQFLSKQYKFATSQAVATGPLGLGISNLLAGTTVSNAAINTSIKQSNAVYGFGEIDF